MPEPDLEVESVRFVGIRTTRFAEMVALYRDVLRLVQVHDAPGAAWFRLADGTEVHVYGPGDEDHDFFGSGPVVGWRVADFRRAHDALSAAGIEFIGDVQRAGAVGWNHYRGPDGNVYEIIGPMSEDATDR